MTVKLKAHMVDSFRPFLHRVSSFSVATNTYNDKPLICWHYLKELLEKKLANEILESVATI